MPSGRQNTPVTGQWPFFKVYETRTVTYAVKVPTQSRQAPCRRHSIVESVSVTMVRDTGWARRSRHVKGISSHSSSVVSFKKGRKLVWRQLAPVVGRAA